MVCPRRSLVAQCCSGGLYRGRSTPTASISAAKRQGPFVYFYFCLLFICGSEAKIMPVRPPSYPRSISRILHGKPLPMGICVRLAAPLCSGIQLILVKSKLPPQPPNAPLQKLILQWAKPFTAPAAGGGSAEAASSTSCLRFCVQNSIALERRWQELLLF